MSTPKDSQTAPKVTVKLTAQYTRETLLIEAWVDAAEEAKGLGTATLSAAVHRS